MIKVCSSVPVLEVDGQKVDSNAKEKPILIVRSNWHTPHNAKTEPIILEIRGVKYTVDARDLDAAIENAVNRAPR